MAFLKRFSRASKPELCRCGILPAHGPSIAACSAVAKKAGYKVSSLGFIIDKKNHVFFDGVEWLNDPR